MSVRFLGESVQNDKRSPRRTELWRLLKTAPERSLHERLRSSLAKEKWNPRNQRRAAQETRGESAGSEAVIPELRQTMAERHFSKSRVPGDLNKCSFNGVIRGQVPSQQAEESKAGR